ncbi:MAG: lamin tail domain-containing protein [Candidatus Sabulitectum sp.]|nr:lamin tail domain-containing protein [Candidatus Sabulitectum sp.]
MIMLLTVLILTGGSAPLNGTTDGGGIVINEIMIDPLASSSTEMGQWIEVHNNSSDWVNLSDWTIENQNGEEIEFSSHVIPPDGYFVVGASALTGDNGNYTPDAVWSSFSLSLSGSLQLNCINADSEEFFSWNSSWDLEPGASLERLNPGWAAYDRESWLHSTSVFGDGDLGTPGDQNSVFSNGFGQNTWAFIKAFVH